ncbi:MAG: hypothetical protein ACOH2M_19340 [Cypionkella sp.]
MKSLVRVAVVAALGALGLTACEKDIKAPFDRGVCYVVELGEEGTDPVFNKIAENQSQIEFCAARLEEVRSRFLRLGGNRTELVGAYQGSFLFLDSTGVRRAQSLNGTRYFMMARTGDGRLAVPGTIEQRPAEPTPAP